MIELMGIMLALAIVDSLNPATIGTMAILLPLVKKVEDSLFFLFSTYITYFFGGLFLYLGVDQLLGEWFRKLFSQYVHEIATLELIGGVVIIGIALWLLIRQPKGTSEPSMKQAITFKSMQPGYLFVFGIGSTLSDLPTALPLIGFISKLIEIQPSPVRLIMLLVVYVLIYVSPLIVLFVIYTRVQEKTKRFATWFNHIFHSFNQYVLPPLLFVIGIWMVVDGFRMLFGYS